MQRLSRLEEEEKNNIETRKRRFFTEVRNAVREYQLQIQASVKRQKHRNDNVLVRIFVFFFFFNYPLMSV